MASAGFETEGEEEEKSEPNEALNSAHFHRSIVIIIIIRW